MLTWQLAGETGLVRNVEGAAAPGAIGSGISADGSLVASELPGDVVRLFDVDRNAAERVAWDTPFGRRGLHRRARWPVRRPPVGGLAHCFPGPPSTSSTSRDENNCRTP